MPLQSFILFIKYRKICNILVWHSSLYLTIRHILYSYTITCTQTDLHQNPLTRPTQMSQLSLYLSQLLIEVTDLNKVLKVHIKFGIYSKTPSSIIFTVADITRMIVFVNVIEHNSNWIVFRELLFMYRMYYRNMSPPGSLTA